MLRLRRSPVTVLCSSLSITGVAHTPSRILSQRSRVRLMTRHSPTLYASPTTQPLPRIEVATSSRGIVPYSTPSHRQADSHSTDYTLKMPDTPEQIIAKLPERFDKARDEGDLLFFPSTIQKHHEFGVEVREFVLHYLLGLKTDAACLYSGRSACVLPFKTSPLYLRHTSMQLQMRGKLYLARRVRSLTLSHRHT